MWTYDKKLQYPVKIKNPNPKLANIIISQLGGPDGELGASMRYLHQRYSCPYEKITGILTDVGTEELAHLEMVAAIIHQLTKNLTLEQIDGTPFAAYFVDHTTGAYPVAASGEPFNAVGFQSTGDIIADLHEDMAAEQKARKSYDNLITLIDDPDVLDPLKYLREREIVHFRRSMEFEYFPFDPEQHGYKLVLLNSLVKHELVGSPDIGCTEQWWWTIDIIGTFGRPLYQ